MKQEPIKEAKKSVQLRTPADLVSAHEQVFNLVNGGSIDTKTADALNTTLKGSFALLVKSRLDLAKIMVQAQVKKVSMPEHLLPDFNSSSDRPFISK